jgi:hypothetical protein
MFSIEKKIWKIWRKIWKNEIKKTESAFLYELKTINQDSNDGFAYLPNSFLVLWISFWKKNRENYKGKSENSGKMKKL